MIQHTTQHLGTVISTILQCRQHTLSRTSCRLALDQRLIVVAHSDDAVDEDGSTALMGAAFVGSLPIMRLLLEAGARASISNADGSLPENVAPIGHMVRRILHDADEREQA